MSAGIFPDAPEAAPRLREPRANHGIRMRRKIVVQVFALSGLVLTVVPSKLFSALISGR